MAMIFSHFWQSICLLIVVGAIVEGVVLAMRGKS